MLRNTRARARGTSTPSADLRRRGCVALATLAAIAAAIPTAMARAQQDVPAVVATPLDSLVARALEVSPRLRASRARVEAAEARVAPAGARPDPMLMAGIQNFP